MPEICDIIVWNRETLYNKKKEKKKNNVHRILVSMTLKKKKKLKFDDETIS